MTIYTKIIPQETFSAVYNMLPDHPWLSSRSEALSELWGMCENNEQQSLVRNLFDRFTFVDHDQLRRLQDQVVSKISSWACDSSNLFISAVADSKKVGSTAETEEEDVEVDGSNSHLQRLKNKFSPDLRLGENNFGGSLCSCISTLTENTCLVLFDDFVGTGGTLVRKVKSLLEKISFYNKPIPAKIMCTALFGMKFGCDRFRDEMEMELYCPLELMRGIADYGASGTTEQDVLHMLELEQKLYESHGKYKLHKYSLGYKKSQALFNCCDENCPNNVFPVFWWNRFACGKARKTICHRL